MSETTGQRPSGRGRFITFEGGEGTGKSTQIKKLAERLSAARLRILVTREPGGSPGADRHATSPPSAPIRSAMFDSPAPAGVLESSKPGPVSVISNRSSPGTASRMIVTAAPGACLPAFANASRQQK